LRRAINKTKEPMSLKTAPKADSADEDIITTAELDEKTARLVSEASPAQKGKRRAEDDEDEDMAEDDDVERPQFKKLKGNDSWVGLDRIWTVRALLTPFWNLNRRAKRISGGSPFRRTE
jgi:hypothetical protein